MTADLIVTNGKIITMNRDRAAHEALAVVDGRIIATGGRADIEKLAGKNTERLDLQGRTVTPGLIDTHIHVASLGSIGAGTGLAFVDSESGIDITRATTTREVAMLIAERIRQIPKGEWIVTSFPLKLAAGQKLTKDVLDPVSPDNPVFISGYPYVVVNSYVLRQAGIRRNTEAPKGGELHKDPVTGEPNGVLAYQAVYQLLPTPPQPSVDETERAILRCQDAFLSEGLTTYKDAGLRDNAIQAYRNLRESGTLKCRTQMLYTWQWSADQAKRTAAQLMPFAKDDWLMLRSVKLSLDGGIPSKSAWSYDEWNKDYAHPIGGCCGYAKVAPDVLEQMVDILHSAGLQISCHCEGDRAIDTYLDAIEKALARTPRRNCRHTVIHCDLPTDKAIERMHKLGDNIAIEAQSPWLAEYRWAASCGPERSKRFLPLKTWLRKGLTVGNGCDFPPKEFPPRLGLWSACTREVENDVYGKHPYGVMECLTFEEALHTYTLGAAKCLFWEDNLGSLEPGKYADFVVWDRDLAAIPPEQLKDAKAMITVVSGKTAFHRN